MIAVAILDGIASHADITKSYRLDKTEILVFDILAAVFDDSRRWAILAHLHELKYITDTEYETIRARAAAERR